jgi:hypothetical protein
VSPVPRARWRDELAQAQVPASLRPMKATLLALVPLMTTTGELHVWRDRMVKATGLPPRTLNHHLRRAGESGWLTRTVRGATVAAAGTKPPCPAGVVSNGWRTTRGVVSKLLVLNSPRL